MNGRDQDNFFLALAQGIHIRPWSGVYSALNVACQAYLNAFALFRAVPYVEHT